MSEPIEDFIPESLRPTPPRPPQPPPYQPEGMNRPSMLFLVALGIVCAVAILFWSNVREMDRNLNAAVTPMDPKIAELLKPKAPEIEYFTISQESLQPFESETLEMWIELNGVRVYSASGFIQQMGRLGYKLEPVKVDGELIFSRPGRMAKRASIEYRHRNLAQAAGR